MWRWWASSLGRVITWCPSHCSFSLVQPSPRAVRDEGRERRPLMEGLPLSQGPKLSSSSPKFATQSARPEPCKTGENLPAGLIHCLLLGLVSTYCQKIITLVSGRTPLMSKGTVCPAILVICLGFLLTEVAKVSKKMR